MAELVKVLSKNSRLFDMKDFYNLIICCKAFYDGCNRKAIVHQIVGRKMIFRFVLCYNFVGKLISHEVFYADSEGKGKLVYSNGTLVGYDFIQGKK